jgi:glutamine cyclotransferase
MAVARFFILLLCLAPALTLAVEKFTYRVVDKLPQSRDNFVQGLQIIDDHLYVSTGNYGKSHLLRYQFPEGTLYFRRGPDRTRGSCLPAHLAQSRDAGL